MRLGIFLSSVDGGFRLFTLHSRRRFVVSAACDSRSRGSTQGILGALGKVGMCKVFVKGELPCLVCTSYYFITFQNVSSQPKLKKAQHSYFLVMGSRIKRLAGRLRVVTALNLVC